MIVLSGLFIKFLDIPVSLVQTAIKLLQIRQWGYILVAIILNQELITYTASIWFEFWHSTL